MLLIKKIKLQSEKNKPLLTLKKEKMRSTGSLKMRKILMASHLIRKTSKD